MSTSKKLLDNWHKSHQHGPDNGGAGTGMGTMPTPSGPGTKEKMMINVKELQDGTSTPWKINMKPKNVGLEDDFPFHFFGDV